MSFENPGHGFDLENLVALETRNSKPQTVSMRLVINGKKQTFGDALSLAQLIEQLGMKGDRVAVELNREIVSRTQWPGRALHDGDQLEIVHFVGGGVAA
jgi:sulfur carrier protein